MVKMPMKILLSARDPGATDNMLQLFNLLQSDPDFRPVLVASGVASKQMHVQKAPHIQFSLLQGQDHIKAGEDPSLLLSSAQKIYTKIKPDIVVVSLSSFGAGIDEALIFVSSVPVFAIQDFWGDVNDILGKFADLYFVLDKDAETLSRKRFGVKTLPIGLPKYLRYRDVDFQKMKSNTRKTLGINPSDKLVGWFGQSSKIPGHSNVLTSFIQAGRLLDPNIKILIKDHPKFAHESENGKRRLHQYISDRICLPNEMLSTDELLTACDVVVTPFSLCGLDHAVMSSMSPVPIGSVVYLMNNQNIRQFAKETAGMVRFPIVKTKNVGICVTFDDPPKIAKTLESQMMPVAKQAYHQNSKAIVLNFNYRRFKQCILEQETNND